MLLQSSTLVAIIIELVCGAAGGTALRFWLRGGAVLGTMASAFTGAIGGLVFTWLAARLPSVAGFVSHVENAADAATQGVGGLTPTVLVGTGISGLLGGALLTALAAFARNAPTR